MDIERRTDELIPIYRTLPDYVILHELEQTFERKGEQTARQMAITKVLGERAVNEMPEADKGR